MSGRRWIVAQIGAREHYAVPRSLHRCGRLDSLYTDAWCRWGAGLLRRGPAGLRKFAGRVHAELASSRVVALTLPTLGYRLARRGRRGATPVERITWANLDFAAWFDRHLARRLARRRLERQGQGFFGFQTASLGTIRALRDRGIVTVLDQAGAGRVEDELLREQIERWEGWARIEGPKPEAYHRRVAAEWEAARLVLVNSRWSRSALVKQGVPGEKIIVVPLAFEPGVRKVAPRAERSGPLRVLSVGRVVLMKGLAYLIDAARRLDGAEVAFTVAGTIGVSERALAAAPANVAFIGPVTRDRVEDLYRQADLFALPTLCDGFAITQLEAMSHGVPVIATPRCGAVVDEGEDGLIVPAADGAALAAAIARLDADRPLLAAMSRRALEKSGRFTLEHYARRFRREVAERLGEG